MEAMRHSDVRALVVSSCASVYGHAEEGAIAETRSLAPENTYGSTKAALEAMMQDYARGCGWRGIALRYFNAGGADPEGELGEAHDPETHLIPLALDAVLGRRPPLVVHGTDFPTPDGTAIRDYVHVLGLAEGHAAALSRLLAGQGGGFDAFNLGTGRGHSVPHSFGPRRPGDPAMLVASAERARRELGWQPHRSDLATQVAHAWAWRQQHGGGV